MMNDSEVQPAVELIRASRRVLVCGHRSPEGDCIGASLALFHGLKQLGKTVSVYNADPLPVQLRFLDGSSEISQIIQEVIFDLIVVLDCANIDRVGPLAAKLPSLGPILNIDHHPGNTCFGVINIIDPEASCAGEMVFRLLKTLGVVITPSIAEAIYAAILADTGSFHYANTGATVFELARELLEAGLEPARVAEGLFERMPLSRLRLLPRVLDTLELAEDGRWAAVSVSLEMMASAGASPSDAEEFVNYPRSLEGVDVALFFREGRPLTEVSFRGKGRVDVSAIARAFGGGGHPNASACRMPGSLEEVKSRVICKVEETLSGAPPLSS